MKNKKLVFKNYFSIIISIFLVGIATLISFFYRHLELPLTNVLITYVLAIILIAWFTNNPIYGIVFSIISTLLYDVFFTEPYYEIVVYDLSHMMTFFVMTITAIIVNLMAFKVKKSAIEAKKREEETKVLFSLTNALTSAKSIEEISEITTCSMSEFLNSDIGFICFDANGKMHNSFIQYSNGKIIRRQIHNKNEIMKNINSNNNLDNCENKEFIDYSISGKDNYLGLIRISPKCVEKLGDSQKKILYSMIESTALAMDRFYSEYHRIKLHEQTVQERYRGNLLRSISHDLRTPLSGIMGTSEMLMELTDKNDQTYLMAQGIYKDAEWLHSLVENVLSLTKLQDDKISIHKEPEALEEIIGGAIKHILSRFPDFNISVDVPNEVVIVQINAKLIEQVLINLMDNAIKHSKNCSEINISVLKQEDEKIAIVKVSDNGEGIINKDLPNIFQAFYTTTIKHSDAKKGIGLGLTICEAIITAHGGKIWASNKTDGHGAIFTFTLPD